MWMDNETEFLARSQATLKEILGHLKTLPTLHLNELNPNDTAIVVVDMVKGFCTVGPLASPRVQALAAPIAALIQQANQVGLPVVAFGDSHADACLEFGAYPPHCIRGTEQAELVEEFKTVRIRNFIPKNSTNGFLEPAFQYLLKNDLKVKNFVVVGDCTDICIQQFALTLKAELNRRGIDGRVVVPLNLVDTYDAPLHNGDLHHVMALANMEQSGVTLCGTLYAQ